MDKKNNVNVKLFRPFGPTIMEMDMPEDVIKNVNDYVEKIVKDKEMGLIRRKIKGSFRVNISKLKAADHVIFVKKNITDDSAAIKKELENLWQKIEKRI